MKRDDFKNKLKILTEQQLYKEGKNLLIKENLGFDYSSWKCDLILEECKNRSEKLYQDVVNDALTTVNSIENASIGSGIIEVKRIDHMSKPELLEVTRGIGVSKELPSIDEGLFKTSDFASVFGVDKENLYFCTVSGDSMKNAGIIEGDMLIIDTSSIPEDSDIIAINIKGKFFIKRLNIIDGAYWMKSENEKYPPIELSTGLNFSIFGVVKHVVKKV